MTKKRAKGTSLGLKAFTWFFTRRKTKERKIVHETQTVCISRTISLSIAFMHQTRRFESAIPRCCSTTVSILTQALVWSCWLKCLSSMRTQWQSDLHSRALRNVSAYQFSPAVITKVELQLESRSSPLPVQDKTPKLDWNKTLLSGICRENNSKRQHEWAKGFVKLKTTVMTTMLLVYDDDTRGRNSIEVRRGYLCVEKLLWPLMQWGGRVD